MKKRFLSMLLVLCMVFTLFPQTAFAENAGDVTIDDTAIGVSSVVDSGGCICMALCTNDQRNPDCKLCSAEGADLTQCKGAAPALLSATPQAAITGDGFVYDLDSKTLTITTNDGTTAWKSNTDISKTDVTTVVMESGVTIIGPYVFKDCMSLTGVTIPSSVTAIEMGAFWGCMSLVDVTIPSSVTIIGRYAFKDCMSLTGVTIPSGVTTINDNVFSYCTKLVNVNIPSSVTTIGDHAFYACDSLTSVAIPSSVTAIGDFVFYGCTNLASVAIPSSVTAIGDSTFANCTSLASVAIPSSVTAIVDSTFANCTSLTSVIIPDSITTIGDYAFSDCSNLASITFEDGTLPTFGTNVFKDTPNTLKIYVPLDKVDAYIAKLPAYADKIEGKKDFGDYRYDPTTKTLTITTNDGTFKWYRISYNVRAEVTTVVMTDDVTSIDRIAFFGCASLANVTIPSSVTDIGQSAFYDCTSLTSVTIPNRVTSIGIQTFGNCKSLTSVTIPNRVTSIGNGAFSGCTGLASVTIPSSVTSIDNDAFSSCSGLASVTFKGVSPPDIFGYNVFDGADADLKIYVPKNSVDAYKAKLTDYEDKIVAAEDAVIKITSSLNLAGITSDVKCTDSNVGAKIAGMTPHTHAAGSTCWEWYGDTNTLTLNSVEIAVTVDNGVTLPANAELVINGDSKVSTTARNRCGIYINSDKPSSTVICGNGKLDVSGEYGISAGSGSLTISGSNLVINANAINGDGIKAGALEILSCIVNALGNQYGIRVDEGDIVLGNSGGSRIIWVKAQGGTSALSKAPILNPHPVYYTTTGAWDAGQASWIIPQGAPDDDSGGGSTGGDGGDSTSPTGGTAGGVTTPGKTVIDNLAGAQGSANALTEAVKNALATGKTSRTVYTNFANYTALTKEGVEAINDAAAAAVKGKSVTLNTKVQLDNKVGSAVVSRITVDPAKLAAVMPEKLPLGIYFDQQKDAKVQAVRNKFEKHFDNKIVSVVYEQRSPLAVNAEFCAKLNLAEAFGQDHQLYFYTYDNEKNTYNRIWSPGYWVDQNGYAHIDAPFGGSLIITDKPPAKK